MHIGYLTVETHPEHKGVIRLAKHNYRPHTPDGAAGGHISYVARYNDIDAAMMHVHEVLKRRLVDLDHHLYRTDLVDAIAAAKSRVLAHRDIWIDPDLDQIVRERIDTRVAYHKERQARWNRIMVIVSKIAIGLLIAEAVMMLFAF